MTVYVVIILSILFCHRLSNNISNNNKWLWFAVGIIFFIVGFRDYGVGNDTIVYSDMYVGLLNHDLKYLFNSHPYSHLEKGFVLYEWLLHKISGNPTFLFSVTALIEFMSIEYWLKNNSDTPLYGLLVFVCMFLTFFMTGLRQSLAIAILLFAYDALKKDKLKYFILLTGIAASIHMSSIMFLWYYVIKKYFVDNKKYAILCCLLYPIVYGLRELIFYRIIMVNDNYSDWEVLDHGDPTMYTALLFLIIVGGIIMPKLTSKPIPPNYYFHLNILSTGFVLMPLVGLNGSMMRVAMYFSLFLCVVVPEIFSLFNSKSERIIVQTIAYAVLIFMFLTNVSNNEHLQYSFIF